jgi:hypothetical protein
MVAKRSMALAVLLAVGCVPAESAEPEPQLAGVTQALSSCSSTPGWTQHPYSPGEQVMVEGNIYACKPWPFSGWCGVGDPYEPGVGWAWRDAWTQVGHCDDALCEGVPAWTLGTTASDVQFEGMKYACKVPGWCASSNSTYAPGAAHGQLAWSRVGRCGTTEGATRALVLVDERLYGELSAEIDTYLKKAGERRGFHIALHAIDGLDDWPYARVKQHIVNARAENADLEGVLLIGNIKLPTFYKPRADILDTRIYAAYLEDFDAHFEKRLTPGAVDPPCGPEHPDFSSCAVGGAIVPEHDFDYMAKGARPNPEIWTAYMPVGVRGSANGYPEFAAQLRPFLQKVIRYYEGGIAANGRFYGVSGDRGERFDLTYATWGAGRTDLYGKPGPHGERGTACITPTGENVCYVRWPLESYPSYGAFDEAYSAAGWVDEGWQDDAIFLRHMNAVTYDVVQVNVHSNEIWSLVTADQARGITRGGLFVGLDGCNVAGYLQPGSPSYTNTWVHVSDNVLMAYLYGASQAIAGSGDPAWRGHYGNLPVLFHAMKHGGQYLGQAHLTRMIANYERASTPYDLKEFANELLVGDPFMKL